MWASSPPAWRPALSAGVLAAAAGAAAWAGSMGSPVREDEIPVRAPVPAVETYPDPLPSSVTERHVVVATSAEAAVDAAEALARQIGGQGLIQVLVVGAAEFEPALARVETMALAETIAGAPVRVFALDP